MSGNVASRPASLEKRSAGAVALLAAAAFALVMIGSSSFGIGVSPDSLEYFAAAQSLAHGDGYRGVNGDAFVGWPPLYPTVLAAGPLVGIPVLTFARWLQAVLASVAVATTGGILTARIRWWPLGLLSAAACLGSKPMLMTESFAWSEPLFIVFVLATLAGLSRYLRTASRRVLLLSSCAAACACLTRYPGMVLVPVAVGCILVLGRGSRRTRLSDSGLFTAIAVFPLGLWMIRNLISSGTLTGPRLAATTTLTVNLAQACRTFNAWLLPRDVTRVTEAAAWLTGIVTVSILAGVAWLVLAAARRSGGPTSADRRSHLSDVVPLVVFVAAFFLVTVAAASTTIVDRLGNRLLSPLYVPLLLAAALSAGRLLELTPSARLLVRRRVVAVTAMCLLMLTAEQGRKTVVYLARKGQGYTSRHWLERSVIQDAMCLPRGSVVWTSHPAVIRLLAGRAALLSPVCSETDDPAAGLLCPGLSDGQSVYLVWFGDEYPRRPRLLTPEQLQGAFDVAPYFQRDDGALYRLCARQRTVRSPE